MSDWLDFVGLSSVVLGAAFGFVASRRKFPQKIDPLDIIPEDFKRKIWEAERKQKEHFWEYVLIIGLGLELMAMPFHFWEIALLNSATETLRQKNLALEAELQWREITAEQKKKILTSLESVRYQAKCKVVINADHSDFEARSFAKEIGGVLTEAGFEVKVPSSIIMGINDNGTTPQPTGWEASTKSNLPYPGGSIEIVEALRTAEMIPEFFGLNPNAPDDTLVIDVFHKPHKSTK